jgi:hypothetical protein
VLAFDWEWAGWGTPVARSGSITQDLICAYWSVKVKWLTMGAETLEHNTYIGTILRLLASVDWVAGGLASW